MEMEYKVRTLRSATVDDESRSSNEGQEMGGRRLRPQREEGGMQGCLNHEALSR